MKLMNIARKYGRQASVAVSLVGATVFSGLTMAADATTIAELTQALATPAAEAKTGALAIAGIVGGIFALLFAIYIVLGMMKRRG